MSTNKPGTAGAVDNPAVSSISRQRDRRFTASVTD